MRKEEQRILHLRDGLTWKEKQIAVEMARLFGFQSESAVFPVVSRESGEEIPKELGCLDKFREMAVPAKLPQDYHPATDAAKPVPDFDWRGRKGLETLFTVGRILKDENLDLLPDKMDVHFVMREDAGLSVLAAACTFAFRMGMETTAYEGILLTAEEGEGNAIVFEEAEPCSVSTEEKEHGVRILVTGKGEQLEAFAADFCEHFPLQGEFDTWTDRLQGMIDSMAMQNLDGQLAYAKAYATSGDLVYASPEDFVHATPGDLVYATSGTFVHTSPETVKRKEKIEKEFPEVTFINYKSTEQVYEITYDIPWEVDVFLESMEKEIYPIIKPGDKVRIYAALSEGKQERNAITEQIRESLKDAGAVEEKTTILCAYKQGYSWLEEEAVPALLRKGKPHRAEIGFKPFLPAGVTEWKDEDGATPSYNNISGDPEKWYDLPIRYLQELYPAEDMLAEKLGIEREQIRFYVYEGGDDMTYELKAYSDDETLLYRDSYKTACHERPYLDAYPQMGKVHPSTGYMRVQINGELVLDKRIETDVERIWSVYQGDVLEGCRKYIEEKTGGRIRPEAQPFFSRLQIEVGASEPDYRIGCREDLFTTLDGLHEDIYFAGADYFKNFGMEKADTMLDAPGLILPIIKKKAGKPYMKVTLFGQKAASPYIKNGEDHIYPSGSRQNIHAWLEAVEDTGNSRRAIVRLEGADEKVVAGYAELMRKGLLDIAGNLFHINELELVTANQRYTVSVTAPEAPEKDVDIRDIDLSEKELIGYEKYMEIISRLKRVPNLHVYRTAVSYMGREVYAVEIMPQYEGYLSRTKRITQHPSEIINSRHHANEVSGTNSAFMLIKTLLTDTRYKDIPEKLNLVIVPMENVDGAAIHYGLQKDNPYWKLHVARFNAIGKEFYHEHFKPDTIHTEAMGLTRLYGKFLPDIIVDNHGVPSHEWEQQFSGYTPPSFKGFWLPRSLLYGYFWTVTDEAYKSNYKVNKKMEDIIADSMAADPEISHWNKEWANQFEKFAHGWMPKLFPANYYKDMINYWIPFAHDPAHRYPSIRFPWITTVAYTSEVADETAQGDYLYLCARAHLTHDLVTLEMMAGSTCVYQDRWNITDSSIGAAHTRQRPVAV